MTRRDIAVVGGGLAGYATAVGLALEGFDTLLVAPPAPREDGRSSALLGESVAFLGAIGLARTLETKGEMLATMRLVDDTGRLFRAPTAEFRAGEIGLSGFGYNILNADLLAALQTRAAELSERLTLAPSALRGLVLDGETVQLSLEDGPSFRVDLVVGADGRGSVVRERSGIGLSAWSYPQSAVVLNIAHRLPHNRTSTEFHTRNGPFTQVPLPGRTSSIVWVDTPEMAAAAADLRPERLAERLEAKMHSILGAVEVTGNLQTFALKGASAARMAAPRVALVGEAAHVFPPIGAQGLNLGLRDAAAIVAVAASNRDDPGSRRALGRYEAMRRSDVATRTVGVDLLNRSLLASFVPAQLGRVLGLAAMAGSPGLRRFAIREGLAPGAGLGGVPHPIRARMGWDGPLPAEPGS